MNWQSCANKLGLLESGERQFMLALAGDITV